MDRDDQEQQYAQQQTGYSQHAPESGYKPQDNGYTLQSYDQSVGMQNGGVDYASHPQDSQIPPNGNLEGHLRNMIMHHNTAAPSQSPHMPIAIGNPLTGEENENMIMNHPSHPPQHFPPHFPQGYVQMPPIFMHGPAPGMYPPHIPIHPYPMQFDGPMLPYPMPQPFHLGQYPPPGYGPMPPEQVSIRGYVPPVESSEGQPGNLPAAPRQFERNGPRHQRNHSYPKPHQKYPPRRQYDKAPLPPRVNEHGFHSRQQQQQAPQPGLINDDFPPLGTERAKIKATPPLSAAVEPEQAHQQEGMNGTRRGYMSGPPSGPRYRGGPRNFGPRGQHQQHSGGQQHYQQQPYQPSPQELALLNEVAREQIALATPSAEELEFKKRLRDRLQKLCRNVSPTAELKSFGSLVSGFATVGSDLDLVLVDKEVDKNRPYFEIPLLLEKELKENGLEAQLLAKTRVPILKIKQPATGEYPNEVAADIGFANSLAIRNTHMLSVYSKCDPRVTDVVRFVKRWAKRRRINNPYKGTLSSYGYVLMILHYLMNIVEPPVIPNLQLYPVPPDTPKDEITTEEGHNVWYYKDIEEIERRVAEGTMTTNTMDLATLLLGFFEFYAFRFGWAKDIISIRTKGGLISKVDKGWVAATVRVGKMETEYKDRYLFAIEDPFEISHNVSRTCNFYGVKNIREELKRANRIMRMREGEAALRYKLFEEAPEETRVHQHKQSTANGEHVDGIPAEMERVGVEGNQLPGVATEEERHPADSGDTLIVNGANGKPKYNGLVGVVESLQGLRVDA